MITQVQFYGVLDEVKNKNIEALKVLSHVSISDVGGLSVDKTLAEHVAKEFETKYKVNVRNN